jgi:hypothetical protein
MSLIDDILKGLPENALLRQKLLDLTALQAVTETENAILKDDLHEAKLRIAERDIKIAALQKVIDDLTHKEPLQESDIQILKYIADFADDGRDPWAAVIARDTGLHLQITERCLSRLESAGYISHVTGLGNLVTYQTARQGP